jgi:hypothetical protein
MSSERQVVEAHTPSMMRTELVVPSLSLAALDDKAEGAGSAMAGKENRFRDLRREQHKNLATWERRTKNPTAAQRGSFFQYIQIPPSCLIDIVWRGFRPFCAQSIF